MMSELIASGCVLFGALFFLGGASRRHWPISDGREALRRSVSAAGWIGVVLAVVGFSSHYGLEVGLAWFLLWLAMAALAATVWLSLRPQTTMWVGGLFAATALFTWVL